MCRIRLVRNGLPSGCAYRLRPLGSFVYLDMLKEPFFKIENDYYMIKGVQGKDYFRIAVHGKHEDELQRLEEFLYSGQKKE